MAVGPNPSIRYGNDTHCAFVEIKWIKGTIQSSRVLHTVSSLDSMFFCHNKVRTGDWRQRSFMPQYFKDTDTMRPVLRLYLASTPFEKTTAKHSFHLAYLTGAAYKACLSH